MQNFAQNMPFIIAIDGPAGSGKTSTAKILAEKLGFLYVDTGSMYRAVAYAVLRQGIKTDDENAVCAVLPSLDVRIRLENGEPKTLLNGDDIEGFIRTPEMSTAASDVSRLPCVREAMVELQRDCVRDVHGAILEGRDIGTVVFPEAHCKIYLVADVRTRSTRRKMQLEEQNITSVLSDVEKEIEKRDQSDSKRDHSPLRKAADAIEVETTNTTIGEQVTMILSLVESRLKTYLESA